jgi:hypothetical protein
LIAIHVTNMLSKWWPEGLGVLRYLDVHIVQAIESICQALFVPFIICLLGWACVAFIDTVRYALALSSAFHLYLCHDKWAASVKPGCYRAPRMSLDSVKLWKDDRLFCGKMLKVGTLARVAWINSNSWQRGLGESEETNLVADS